MSNAITCDAHRDLASFMFLYEDIGSIEHEQEPSGRVDGYALVYGDSSVLHIPDDGPAIVDCECGGGYKPKRVKATETRPGGFWTTPAFSVPTFVCDVCGYMCECCEECQGVGGCSCFDT